ncbi:hypothetical protein I4U23_016157 [Adineta vaga]|nr:hypothetical protein I4U23_016157 [Adineta vaga]
MTKSALLEPIAVVGMTCEFAGDIHTPTDLWHALEESRDLGTEIPLERTDLISYCAHMLNQDNGEFQRMLIRRGYFLSTSLLDTFDADYFNLSDGEAASIDPCHRLLMLKFVHLIEDAGYTLEKMRGSRTSVHIGQFSNDHAMATLRLKPEHRTRHHCPHILLYNASARLSYHFDLHGPNVSLDTACASSLQAIHLGVQALRAREADMAVCGGINTIFTPEQLLNFSALGAVSVDGRSRSFSADANGYAKGEGLGLVLLKRLSDAERDSDQIYCVLHDVLSNHDGYDAKKGYVVPSGIGQERLLTEIYSRTQYDRNRIFYAEAHGTGTQVGDPIEANAIGSFFQRSPFDPPLLIGSVRSNIGHTEGTSGVASLIKVAMCMKHKAIPPNMHFTTLNPNIEAQRFNLHVVQTRIPFPPSDPDNEKDYPIAISISSFGIGGNNAHAIVEEYCPKRTMIATDEYALGERVQQSFLFLISAKSTESLHKQVAAFHTWLQQVPSSVNEQSFLARLSHQFLLKRTISYEHLSAFVSVNLTQLRQQVESFLLRQSTPGLLITKRSLTTNPRVCFVFSGQGPQWWAMGRQLYSSEPVFRRWIQLINEELGKINDGQLNLLDEMMEKTEQESRINDTNIAQPALFAIQVALTALLVSWHVFPSAIEAVRIVHHRSRLQHRNTRQGGRMLAVAMGEQEVHDFLLPGIEHLVCVAVVNSPRSVTLSGNETTIDELETILTTFHPNVFKARLRIENAFHSHQMDRFCIREEMLSTLSDIQGLPLQDTQQMFDASFVHIPIYSSVIGRRIDDSTPLDAHHWWSNVRQCVRFGDAIQSIIGDQMVDAFLELSPHPVLATSIRECYDKAATIHPIILPTLKRKEDEQTTLLTSIAQLSHASDVWKHYLASRSILASINHEDVFDTFPLYAFNTTPCWYESKESAIERRAHRFPCHPLLGVRQWSDHTLATWKSLININLPKHAYLIQHKIQDAIVLPATAFLEIALAACRELLPIATEDEIPPPIAFENIEFVKALVLTEYELTEVITQVVMPMREWFVYSRPWSSSGENCMRSSGMACEDFLKSFDDPQTLNTYSLRQFTLHARGRIDVGPHLNIYASLAVRFNDKTPNWSELTPENIYANLSTRGYQYGSSLTMTDVIKNARSRITGCVLPKNGEQNDDCYHLHPLIIDGCLHAVLPVLPGYDTFLPASIAKMIAYGSTFLVPRFASSAIYHSSLAGLSQERAYTFDLTVFDGRHQLTASNTKPIVMFQMFKLQRVPGHWSLVNKSLFDKAAFSLVRHHSLLDEHGNASMSITKHLLQLIRKQILEQFPLLKSLLALLNAIGLQLDQIILGAQSLNEFFVESTDNDFALIDVLHMMSSSKTRCLFQALIEYMTGTDIKRLRILNVGCGSSLTALSILQQLIAFAEETNTHLNLQYVESSATLLAKTKKALESILTTQSETKTRRITVTYRVYDMEAGLDESSVADEAYDIVFAANAVHTTTDVIHSISALRRLVVPGGLLLLVELTQTHPYFDLLFGIFPYWWRDNNRHALLTSDEWTNILQSVGGFDLPIMSSKVNVFGDTLIISRKTTSKPTLIQLPEWKDHMWLLIADRTQELSRALVPHLPGSNVVLLEDTTIVDDICSRIIMMLKNCRQLHLVFAWPLDLIPLGQHSDEAAFNWQEYLCSTFVCILQTIKKYPQISCPFPYVFVLTQNAQAVGNVRGCDPSATPLIGLVRASSVEYARHHIKLLDLQPSANTFTDPLLCPILAQHMIDSETTDGLDEIALCQGVDNTIQRFQWHYELFQTQRNEELLTPVKTTIIPRNEADVNPFQLQVAPSRFVADLSWIQESPLIDNLLPNEILVRVSCVGLNFRDVLKARGLYPHTRQFAQLDRDQPLIDRDSSLGSDFTGIVVRSDSSHLKTGDRVVGLGFSGTFHSHIVVNALHASCVPDQCLMSDEQLATLPTAFLTALLSLKHRIQLKRNQIVLIHAATGATGQACIQYCQRVGAEIIATAGNDEKRHFLQEYYGIKHVFNSRDLSFVNEIRSLFPNGINVVVNSLSGPLLQESIKLLAPHGHFIELGKRDVFGRSSLSLFDLREDCNLHVIDLVLHARDEPNTIHEMIDDIIDHYQKGLFKVIEPLTIFEPSEVIDAFTQCGLGQSMGKMVVRIAVSDKPIVVNENVSNIQKTQKQQEGTMFPSLVCDSGTVLVSGGFGGLGLTISRWMIEKRGVKRIVLMSRRSQAQFENTEANPQFNDWIRLKQVQAEHNASVDVAQVDVTHFKEVLELIECLSTTPYPVRGIIHSAVISDDKLLDNLIPETLAHVMGPKVRGGWNLHQASQIARVPLHFFVMFSSIRNHLIDPGSSGYNAGNEFFEALARYRCEQLQLPALSVGLPAVSGAGMFHRQRDQLTSLYSAQGFETLPTLATFEVVERLFVAQISCPSSVIFAVDWQVLSANKDHLPNQQLADIIEQQVNEMDGCQIIGNGSDDQLVMDIDVIVERTRIAVMRLLGMSNIDRIHVNRSLLSYGMDSLVAVSLYNWLAQEWGVIVPLADIFQGISIQQIASQLHSKLKERLVSIPTTETTASVDVKKLTPTELVSIASTTNEVLSYSGMEGVLSSYPVKNSESTVFCISTSTTVDTEFVKKAANNTSTVYILHASDDKSNMQTCIHKTIAQIRRLQPRGPYSLISIDNESAYIVQAIVQQMKQYTKAGITHH